MNTTTNTMTAAEAAQWADAFATCAAKVMTAWGCTAEQAAVAVWAEMDDRRRFCVAEAARFAR